MQSQRLFIYGTLMRAETNHGYLHSAVYEGLAHTTPHYRLVWCAPAVGPFPGLVDGGNVAVAGEVYRVSPALLATLDEFEGHPTLYVRRPVQLADDLGAGVEAYFLADPGRQAGADIASGDWRTVRQPS